MGQTSNESILKRQILQQFYMIEPKTHDRTLTYLTHTLTHKEYILREICYNGKQEFDRALSMLDVRSKFRCQQITQLNKIQQFVDDGFCSKNYRVFVMWEYPRHALNDQINSRALQKRPFLSSQIRGILSQLTKAMQFFKEHLIDHQSLTTKSILMDQNKIKVVDPIVIPLVNNLCYVRSRRCVKNIYLSPEQCKIIDGGEGELDGERGDVFTAGMIVLECGLLERQSQCYVDQCGGVSWGKVQENLNKFQKYYGRELRWIVDLMLTKDIHTRLNWKQLAERLKRLDQDYFSARQNSLNLKQYAVPQIANTGRVMQTPSQIDFSSYNVPKVGCNYFQTNKIISQSSYQQPTEFTFQSTVSNHLNKPQFPHHKPIKTNTSNQIPQTNIQTYIDIPPLLQMKTTQINKHPTPTTSQQLFGCELPTNRQLHEMFPRQTHSTFRQSVHTFSPKMGEQKYESNSLSDDYIKNIRQVNSITYEHGYVNHFPAHLKDDKNKPIFVLEQFKHGSKYEGYKLRGLRDGCGKFYFQDGGYYDGEWRENRMHGFGKLYYQTQILAYQGYWNNDQFQGIGKLYNEIPVKLQHSFNYKNFDEVEEYWSCYEGQFKTDLKQGRGKLYLTNGDIFQGNFYEDLIEGEGKYHLKDGKVILGYWHKNRLLA